MIGGVSQTLANPRQMRSTVPGAVCLAPHGSAYHAAGNVQHGKVPNLMNLFDLKGKV